MRRFLPENSVFVQQKKFVFVLCFLSAVFFLPGCAREIQTVSVESPVVSGPRVALTFDADMTPKMLHDLRTGRVKSLYDRRIVQTLRDAHASATIFVTGMWAETYPDAVTDLAHNPLFEIANHSYDHAAFSEPCYGLSSLRDAAAKRKEVTKTQDILTSLTGYMPKYFRFPGGCASRADRDLVSALGLRTVDWDVVSGDAYLRDASAIVRQTVSHVRDGSIVVMHFHGGPTAPNTGDALPEIVRVLRERGYRFVTMTELFASEKDSH